MNLRNHENELINNNKKKNATLLKSNNIKDVLK